MDPRGHLLLGAVAGGALWALTGEPAPAAALAAGAVVIDADHALDAWRGGVLFDYRALRRHFDPALPPRLLLLLHFWELWLGGLAAAWLLHLPLLTAFAAGALLHLVIDQCSNPVRAAAYLLLYRLGTGFAYATMLTEAELARRRALAPPAAAGRETR